MKIGAKSPAVVFFVLAYLFSWIFWIPLIFLDSEPGLVSLLLNIAGGQGALVGAIIASSVLGLADGFKRLLLKWRVSIKWYIAALGLPVLVAVVALGVHLLAGGVYTGLPEEPALYLYPLLLLFVMIIGGGLEEPGWRGFALPLLLERYSPFIATMVVGVLWAFWHLPLFFAPVTPQYGLPFGWYFVNTLGLSVVFTWLFLRSKGSTVTAVVLHGGVNAALSYYPGTASVSTALGTMHFFGPITIASWLVAALILVSDRERFFGRIDTPGYLHKTQ